MIRRRMGLEVLGNLFLGVDAQGFESLQTADDVTFAIVELPLSLIEVLLKSFDVGTYLYESFGKGSELIVEVVGLL